MPATIHLDLVADLALDGGWGFCFTWRDGDTVVRGEHGAVADNVKNVRPGSKIETREKWAETLCERWGLLLGDVDINLG